MPNFMMATEAAKAALASAGKTAKDIDCIIVSTCSPDFYYPNTACLVQNLIGAQPCACMDVNTACTGFITAVDIARNFLANDTYKTVLIVASERLTSQIDYTDRASCILFGDGAGAVVIERERARNTTATPAQRAICSRAFTARISTTGTTPISRVTTALRI